MNDLCIYHNDLHRLRLPSLNGMEQNLLFSMITELRDKGSINKISFTPTDLRAMVGNKNATNKEVYEVIAELKTKFFKADYTHIIKDKNDPNIETERTINLFKMFEVSYRKDTMELLRVEMQVNEQFEYMLNNLIKEFTQFELEEFINLSGKYTKTIYRHLKQYRNTGWWQIKWDEFRDILDIPKSKQTGEIDRDILKPAIKELEKERTLEDQKRISFRNLKYEKIKGKGRGRGGSVKGIIFRWDKENTPPSLMKQELIGLKYFHTENSLKQLWEIAKITDKESGDKSLEVHRYDLDSNGKRKVPYGMPMVSIIHLTLKQFYKLVKDNLYEDPNTKKADENDRNLCGKRFECCGETQMEKFEIINYTIEKNGTVSLKCYLLNDDLTRTGGIKQISIGQNYEYMVKFVNDFSLDDEPKVKNKQNKAGDDHPRLF